jgi:hypothetical protein
MENHKTLKYSQTVAGKRVLHKIKKKLSSVGLSNSDIISGEWRRLLPISASGLCRQNEKGLITRKQANFGKFNGHDKLVSFHLPAEVRIF